MEIERSSLMKAQVYLFRTTMICVDSYENKCATGCLYNAYFDHGIAFKSTMELLINIESMLEEMNMPQSFTGKRSFSRSEEKAEIKSVNDSVREGKLATFSLRILFRQNASWQGSVTWCEGRSEESFRSVLELLMLMDSALESK